MLDIVLWIGAGLAALLLLMALRNIAETRRRENRRLLFLASEKPFDYYAHFPADEITFAVDSTQTNVLLITDYAVKDRIPIATIDSIEFRINGRILDCHLFGSEPKCRQRRSIAVLGQSIVQVGQDLSEDFGQVRRVSLVIYSRSKPMGTEISFLCPEEFSEDYELLSSINGAVLSANDWFDKFIAFDKILPDVVNREPGAVT